QRQCRPRFGLDEQHPDGEYRDVNVDEVHRPREAGDPVGDPQLYVGGPPGLFLQDDGVVREFDRQRDPVPAHAASCRVDWRVPPVRRSCTPNTATDTPQTTLDTPASRASRTA